MEIISCRYLEGAAFYSYCLNELFIQADGAATSRSSTLHICEPFVDTVAASKRSTKIGLVQAYHGYGESFRSTWGAFGSLHSGHSARIRTLSRREQAGPSR